MTDIKIIHNPRCSKSRQTLGLLEEKGIHPEIILYLETPPTVAELKSIFTSLKLKHPKEMMRTGETEFKELGLNDATLDSQVFFDAMAKHPKLIERPIVINGDQAAIGRPPESVLEIL